MIFPQIYGVADFPLLDVATGEFGDAYTGTFELLPGSGDNAQDWNWVMTLKTDTAGSGPPAVPDNGASLASALAALSALFLFKMRISQSRKA